MTFVREEERGAAEKRKKTLLAVYIAVAAVYVAAALLLLFLSPDGYVPYLVGDIVLTVSFGFYSLYFFTVAYDFAVKKCKLMEKMLSALPEREYGVFIAEEDAITTDGILARTLLFDIRGVERSVHLFSDEVSLEKGKTYSLEIRAGILTALENGDEA